MKIGERQTGVGARKTGLHRGGASITASDPTGPASASGFMTKDIILRVDNKIISSADVIGRDNAFGVLRHSGVLRFWVGPKEAQRGIRSPRAGVAVSTIMRK